MRRQPLYVVLGFIVVVAILISIAPRSTHRRVSEASIPGSVCAGFGSVASATLTSSVAGTVGNRVYSVTCSDGVQTLYAAP